MPVLPQTPDERRQLFSSINKQITSRDRAEWNRFLGGVMSHLRNLKSEARFACEQHDPIRILAEQLVEALSGVPFLEGEE